MLIIFVYQKCLKLALEIGFSEHNNYLNLCLWGYKSKTHNGYCVVEEQVLMWVLKVSDVQNNIMNDIL